MRHILNTGKVIVKERRSCGDVVLVAYVPKHGSKIVSSCTPYFRWKHPQGRISYLTAIMGA
jgi:hypothetical protein